MAKSFAYRLALIAFASASLHSALVRVDFASAIRQAILMMGLFFTLGLVLGGLAGTLTRELARNEFERLVSENDPRRSDAVAAEQ